MSTYLVGGYGDRPYGFGIFACLPIHYVDGVDNQGSRLSLFSALTTSSDYHDRWNSDPRFTGVCGCGYYEDYIYNTPRTRCGIFHLELINMGSNLADGRLCSRLSKVP